VFSCRGYSTPLTAEQRFDRILLCCLEYSVAYITVHDILHKRADTHWQLCVSRYKKRRLSPGWVADCLKAVGFEVRTEPGMRGMVRLVAQRL
jgi:hypothetical protein